MNGFVITLLLSLFFSFSTWARGLPIHNVRQFLNQLSQKQEGWNGQEVTISEEKNGKVQIRKSEGGYGFSNEDPQTWSYGFGFCTDAEGETMCSEGFGGFKVQNGQLYWVDFDKLVKVKVLQSSPTGLTYSKVETSPEGMLASTIELKLTKAKKFFYRETVRLNGEIERTSVFQGQ